MGSVGLKLYYPDSVKIQHDGIVNLPVGPVHKLQFMEDDISLTILAEIALNRIVWP